MKSFVSSIIGGLTVMVVATVVGIAVNAARPNGVALIQSGAPVETVTHGDEHADTTATAPLPEGAVSLEEMKQLVDSGGAIVIDARSVEEYAEAHIPGAINIPHDRLPEYMETLNSTVGTTDNVVCYCRSPTCDFSDNLATEMKILGYENVRVFTGGIDHWTKAGYPTNSGDVP